jgi:ribosomal protein S18 acetylase RimI-like enzyme
VGCDPDRIPPRKEAISMSTESNMAAVPHSHAAFPAGEHPGVQALTTEDAAWASEILKQAFYTDPLLNFIYGDTINAPGKLDWFFRVTFRLAALYGDCFSTVEKDGVLMMLPPDQTKMTLSKMVQSGFLAAPFKMGWASFSRMMTFMDFAEKEHKAATSIDHYYIMTVGVLPERQGMGIGKKLMTKALKIVDANNMPCYLETQNKSNVPIYQKFGFEVVSTKEIPTGGLHNWGMLRQKG